MCRAGMLELTIKIVVSDTLDLDLLFLFLDLNLKGMIYLYQRISIIHVLDQSSVSLSLLEVFVFLVKSYIHF